MRKSIFKRDPNSLLSRSMLSESSVPPSMTRSLIGSSRLDSLSRHSMSSSMMDLSMSSSLLDSTNSVKVDAVVEDHHYQFDLGLLYKCFPLCTICHCRLYGTDLDNQEICWGCRNKKR